MSVCLIDGFNVYLMYTIMKNYTKIWFSLVRGFTALEERSKQKSSGSNVGGAGEIFQCLTLQCIQQN